MQSFAKDRALAEGCVGSLGTRWSHVQAVGRTAEQLARHSGLVGDPVVRAAWLHDVGYGPSVRASGFHALDGARYLANIGLDLAVVSLVAFHTGAMYEAEERGLDEELAEFEAPDPDSLDLLTMIDLAVGPNGSAILDSDRLAEVLARYDADNPVARAVKRSRPSLLSASRRAKNRLGLPDDWPLCSR